MHCTLQSKRFYSCKEKCFRAHSNTECISNLFHMTFYDLEGLCWVKCLSQARQLEWVAVFFSRGLPDPGIKPMSPTFASGFFAMPAMQETWVRKILWRRKWQPTPLFMHREFHGQRSLAVYGPWSRKESDTTEQLTLPLSLLLSHREAAQLEHRSSKSSRGDSS